jgi:FtsH-binding integral membrane protein
MFVLQPGGPGANFEAKGENENVMDNQYTYNQAVSELGADARASFINKTYAHLFAAIAAFTLIEIAVFKAGLAAPIAQAMMGVSWLLVLGGFVLVSWLASHAAHKVESKALQYLALSAFVVAEAVIFIPLLYIADRFAPGVISSAAMITCVGFAVLTAIVFITRKDFSFLKGILFWAGIVALAAIVGSVIFHFTLGVWFSVAMIALAGGCILYDTSNVLHHYPEDRYVAAALELFASVALMLWYVIRLLLSMRR